MKGIMIYSMAYDEEYLEDRDNILKEKVIVLNNKDERSFYQPYQPNKFNRTPLVFSSYYCRGYANSYKPKGIIFETDEPIVYACPVDNFELMRGGKYLPGYETFLFYSIDDMLKKYPSSLSFKKDFQDYFKNLNPLEIHPSLDKNSAEIKTRLDYCLCSDWLFESYNEIAFKSPIGIKNCIEFDGLNDLERYLQSKCLKHNTS